MKNFSTNRKIAAPVMSVLFGLAALSAVSCNKDSMTRSPSSLSTRPPGIALSLGRVAWMLAELPLEIEQVREVQEAVSASIANGYDEEYPFWNLLEDPGTGVGDAELLSRFPELRSRASGRSEEAGLLRNLLSYALSTRSESPAASRNVHQELVESGFQIYWPYFEEWDGKTLPVITFHPENGSESNVGYLRVPQPDGSWKIEEMTVDEELAMQRPVWVVNRNEDAGGMTPQLFAKLAASLPQSESGPVSRAGSGELRTLTLKEFRASRNYDSWFAGASEFYVKCGSVENFTASTEEDLLRYHPSITDFMIVVRRKQVNHTIPFNAVLVSEWTSQLQDSAFLIIEDDGGTRTSWKCSANVKIKSKVYGFDVELPFRSHDDIVWRGRLSNRYFEKYNNLMGHYGDVSITFRIASI
jgi:hypothetical protein